MVTWSLISPDESEKVGTFTPTQPPRAYQSWSGGPPPPQYEWGFGKKFQNAFDNNITNAWLSPVTETSWKTYHVEQYGSDNKEGHRDPNHPRVGIKFEKDVLVKKVIILPDPAQLNDEYDEPKNSNYHKVCLYHLNPHDDTDRERLKCTGTNFKPKFPSETKYPYGEAIVFEPNFIGTSFVLEYFVTLRGSASGAFSKRVSFGPDKLLLNKLFPFYMDFK